jgi:hypothetical protein
LEVIVNSDTEIQGKPKTGQHVYINTTRLSDGKLMAVAVNLKQPDANKESSEILVSPDETPEPHSIEQLESSKPTHTATPNPTQKVPPTSTRRVSPTATPTPKVKLTPTQRKSQTLQNNNDGVQEEKQEPAGTEENDHLMPTPTPTPTGPGRSRHNSSLVPTPNENAGRLIQSAYPDNGDEPAIQSSPDPADNCLVTPENPDSPSGFGLLPDTQTNNPDCTPWY